MPGKPGGIHARCDHRRRIGRRDAGSSLAHVTWGLRNPDDPKHAVLRLVVHWKRLAEAVII